MKGPMKKDRAHDPSCNREEGPPMSFRLTAQHLFNPLHVYCRLRELGLSGDAAHKICGVYERLYRLLGLRPSVKTPAD